MLKLSLEEREIESISFNSLVVLGPLVATLSKKRLKSTLRVFSVEINPTMTELSMKAPTQPLMMKGRFL